jgi:hypothetical protein
MLYQIDQLILRHTYLFRFIRINIVIPIYRKVIPIDIFDFEFPIVRNDWSE